VGAVYGGLDAAANFAEAFGEAHLAQKYRRAADEIREGALGHLWREDVSCFASTANRQKDGRWEIDPAFDASLVGLWRFGAFDPDEPRVVDTMQKMRDHLWVQTEVGGLARYEGDDYHRVTDDVERVPGNPWFISTLWLAQWHIATAKKREGLEPALELLEWCARHALHSAVMAEQVHPFTGAPLSVSPLTWSHAEFVYTVLRYVERREELG
jgi:GH15 family glucan-1,4-alpha-glucosidase